MALSLAINDLDAGYGAVKALRGVTLHVEAGETVALLGTNGNGKSTLMKCVAGLVRPKRGSMLLTIDGKVHDLTRLSTEAIVDLGVALVPEGRRLFPKLTVLENLMLGAFRKAARRNIDRNLALAFETFPALKGLQGQLAGTMSGGQQQMLAIARALMSSPRLLLIDEPSVGLSPLLVSQTIAKIGELNQHLGLTVLMAEQNFNQAIRIADRGYIIVHGEIVVAADSVDELRGNDIVKRLYLGGMHDCPLGVSASSAKSIPEVVTEPAHICGRALFIFYSAARVIIPDCLLLTTTLMASSTRSRAYGARSADRRAQKYGCEFSWRRNAFRPSAPSRGGWRCGLRRECRRRRCCSSRDGRYPWSQDHAGTLRGRSCRRGWPCGWPD